MVLLVTTIVLGCGTSHSTSEPRAPETRVSHQSHSDCSEPTACESHATCGNHAGSGDHVACHGNEGPHGGRLVVLGYDHTYHAELIEDTATRTIVIFILDAQLDELPITPDTVTLNVTRRGGTAVFRLTAVGHDAGHGSSRFESADPELYQALAHEEIVVGKLRVTIGGVPYVGRLAQKSPSPDHAGHIQ